MSHKIPESTQATIVNLSHDGRGVARVNGKATFIQGALPDEVVEFSYIRVKKDYDEGKLQKIIEPSSMRVDAKCPHYHSCGGCSLQHVDENKQIDLKQDQVMDLINRYGHTAPKEILPPLKAASWHYRYKARLSVRYVEKKQSTLIGFREVSNPRYIAEINQCSILHEHVGSNIPALRALIDSLDDKKSIAQIEVAAGDDEVALIFRNLNPLNEKDTEKLRDFAKLHAFKLYLQPSGPDSVYLLYPDGASEYLEYALPQFGLTYQFHPTDFTQVNYQINRAMIDLAIRLMDLKSTDCVLDLFCGLGNFSLPLAKFCSQVVGVEGGANMVERAYRNALNNGLSNLSFYAANLDCEEQVKNLASYQFNKLLIDPPRSGALAVVKYMDKLAPERIVYVSCNPITLARDTEVLVNHGYTLQKAGVMDMFPHTMHVETIALFVKGKA